MLGVRNLWLMCEFAFLLHFRGKIQCFSNKLRWILDKAYLPSQKLMFVIFQKVKVFYKINIKPEKWGN